MFRKSVMEDLHDSPETPSKTLQAMLQATVEGMS
jgi:hypothetical protein